MARAIESGLPRRRIEAAAARRQARIDRGLDRIVGVNAFRLEREEPLAARLVDTSAVRDVQVRRLAELKKRRDPAQVAAALSALKRGAGTQENLLELSMLAIRSRATVGEISDALAEVFGRYEAKGSAMGGVYGGYFTDDAEWGALVGAVRAFSDAHGRRPRILVAKLGQDGHDRGQKVVASALADLGFDVDLGPLFSTPSEVARQAVENDVHVIGISTQAGGHRVLLPELVAELRAAGAADVKVVCGGIVPPEDHAALERAGVAAVFGPGTPVTAIAQRLLELLGASLSEPHA
jgi:methylmalonyl-CoA mutase